MLEARLSKAGTGGAAAEEECEWGERGAHVTERASDGGGWDDEGGAGGRGEASWWLLLDSSSSSPSGGCEEEEEEEERKVACRVGAQDETSSPP